MDRIADNAFDAAAGAYPKGFTMGAVKMPSHLKVQWNGGHEWVLPNGEKLPFASRTLLVDEKKKLKWSATGTGEAPEGTYTTTFDRVTGWKLYLNDELIDTEPAARPWIGADRMYQRLTERRRTMYGVR